MVILGIDPGTTRIGIGVVEKRGEKLTHKKSGLLPVSQEGDEAMRLLSLERSLKKLLCEVRPDRVGVEKLFFSKNKKTALAVSQAKGIIIKTAAEYGAQLVEISPREAKMAVTGGGNAGKKTVAKMVGMLLGVSFASVADDATDALAIAIAATQKTPEELEKDRRVHHSRESDT